MLTDNNGVRNYRPCRSELQHPGNDWEHSWKLARLPGLDSDQITFLWRLLHNLLPNQNRISKILKDQDPSCKMCLHPLDDLLHLFHCTSSRTICDALQKSLNSIQPNISPQQILLLSLKLEPSQEFPAVWLISSTLMLTWTQRTNKKQCNLFEIRSALEARISLLRKGKKFQSAATLLETLVKNFF